MRLISFESAGDEGRRPHLGALVSGDADDGAVVDLTAAVSRLLVEQHATPDAAVALAEHLVPRRLLDLVRGGDRSRAAADEALAAAQERGWEEGADGARIRWSTSGVRHLPAISDPPLLRDFMAFEEHLLNVFPKLGREIPPEWYRRPVYYKGNPSAIGAHGDDVPMPPFAERLDLEFEFAAVIGRDALDVAEEDALDHVFGYTIYDDVSARDIQAEEMTVGLGPAKGKDFLRAHVLGPVVVTADELGSPYGRRMTATVNGEQWTDGSSDDMHWRFEQMIAYASRGERVRAGEVFGSGTVGGGSGAEQGRSLAPGDVVELRVEGLGTLRNRIGTNPGAAALDTR